MDKWQSKILSEIGILERGKGLQKSDFVENGIPCIHYGQIFTYYGGFTDSTISFVSVETAKNCTIVYPGDVILAITSENVQDLCKSTVWLGKEKIVTGGHSGIFRHKQNPKFIGYYFQTEYFNSQKAKYAKGTKVVEINPEDILKRIKINLPDLETQRKIVAILEKWDAVIENLKQQISEEEVYFRWLNQKLLEQNQYALGSDNIGKLSDVASIKTGKKDVNQGNVNGKYPFFTCAKEPSRSDSYSFEGEAILLAGNGEIGTSFYYNGKFEAYQRTYVLQDFKNCKSKFIFYVINYLFKKMIEKEKQMSAMPYIKLGTLQNFTFYLPPIGEQERIVKILETQEQKTILLRQKLLNYEQQRKYLLNRLLSGKENV